jgi:hypothetical protein
LKPQLHRAKAERIERSLGKLEPRDYEIRIDGAMLAASHYANLALHRLGLVAEDSDMIHTEFLRVIDYRRFEAAAKPLLVALEAIEDLRAPFVRGAAPGGEAAGQRAIELLAVVRREALAAQPIGFPIVDYRPEAATS